MPLTTAEWQKTWSKKTNWASGTWFLERIEETECTVNEVWRFIGPTPDEARQDVRSIYVEDPSPMMSSARPPMKATRQAGTFRVRKEPKKSRRWAEKINKEEVKKATKAMKATKKTKTMKAMKALKAMKKKD